MIIQEITDRSSWQAFFEETGSRSFMQSWEWGEVEKTQGYDLIRLGVYQNKKLLAIAQVVKIKAKRGNFLFVPHGPNIMSHKTLNIEHCVKHLRNYLIDLAKKEHFSFIRIAPALNNTEENRKVFVSLGFKKAPTYMSAESVWILPLTAAVKNPKTAAALPKTDAELLADMRKTTRYLIKKAQKDGVTIEIRTDEKAVADFYRLYEETVKREDFVPFSQDLIASEFQEFHKTGNALFLFGMVNNPVGTTLGLSLQKNNNYLASALVLFTKSSAFYHQGASIHSKIPVTYLLQWEAIKEAKKRGCQFYNFWGVYRPGRTPKSWPGLSLFKMGFSGQQIDYVLPQDYIVSAKYYLTYIYEKFLNWRRGV